MSNESRKGEGMAEKIGGKIKQGLGKLVGDERMRAEGEAKAARGEARVEDAKASERTKGTIQEAVGAVKNRVGAVIDDAKLQREGKAKELEGEHRQSRNR